MSLCCGCSVGKLEVGSGWIGAVSLRRVRDVVPHPQVHDVAPEELQTTMQSLVGSCWVGVGQGSAAWIGGLLLHGLGEVTLFKVSAAVALASSLLPTAVACAACRLRSKKPPATSAPVAAPASTP